MTAISKQYIEAKMSESRSNVGKPIRVRAGYYMLHTANGFDVDIERVNSNTWKYQSGDADLFGETYTLADAVYFAQQS